MYVKSLVQYKRKMIIKNCNSDFPQFVILFRGFLYKGENWRGNCSLSLTKVLNKDLAVAEFQILTLLHTTFDKKIPAFSHNLRSILGNP